MWKGNNHNPTYETSWPWSLVINHLLLLDEMILQVQDQDIRAPQNKPSLDTCFHWFQVTLLDPTWGEFFVGFYKIFPNPREPICGAPFHPWTNIPTLCCHEDSRERVRGNSLNIGWWTKTRKHEPFSPLWGHIWNNPTYGIFTYMKTMKINKNQPFM